MNDITFKVSKVPVEELLPGFEAMSKISHAIIKDEDKKILSWRSADYALIRNQDIIDRFSEFFIEKGIPMELETQNYRDVSFKISFKMSNHAKSILKGDQVVPEFYVNNSYNGSRKYGFGMGVMRLVCSNGLTIMTEVQKLIMLHTPGADEGIAVEKSLKLIQDFLPAYEAALEPYYELAESRVRNIPNRIQEVVDSTDFPVGLSELAIARADFERAQFKLEPSDWLVYNAVNYVLNHEAETLMGRKAESIDRQVLDYLYNF